MTERLMLLDTASLYFRAFYGVPDTVRAPDGSPINAVRGLLDMITKLVSEFGPTSLIACWDDAWRPQWRVDLIPSYKQHRVAEEVDGGVDVEEVPEQLTQQLPLIRQMLEVYGVPIVGVADHEADDIIGSFASQASGPVDVVTGDRDLFQLVDDAKGVRVIYTARGMSRLEVVTDSVIQKKYGITPRQYVDFAVLRGDASDGLPGVAGIGEKTASTLLGEHGDLAGIIDAAQDARSTVSASVRSKLSAASAYLEVAPRVVEVVRDLDFGDVDARISPLSQSRLGAAADFASTWGLGSTARRALAALGNA
ncbi:5'-3' exonuclease [Subtercola boreus]|uniref:5'-3' exonuclease n=1 Tax=Subtercola boreus TaxID=120213 RepID=A0A3E0W9N0_9MICO|nr:5'-3' exonuclease [Subtercola boreus]RFA19090.1 flap endonuclease [Subtercola boreus]RFA19228.1 flap endonuclease [Subtercola boreus]RFA25690.1 flap endonuclease [Subtercola boreus]